MEGQHQSSRYRELTVAFFWIMKHPMSAHEECISEASWGLRQPEDAGNVSHVCNYESWLTRKQGLSRPALISGV